MGTALLRSAIKGSKTRGGSWRTYRCEKQQPAGTLVGIRLGLQSAGHSAWHVASTQYMKGSHSPTPRTPHLLSQSTPLSVAGHLQA